jgi:hypothetical protein
MFIGFNNTIFDFSFTNLSKLVWLSLKKNRMRKRKWYVPYLYMNQPMPRWHAPRTTAAAEAGPGSSERPAPPFLFALSNSFFFPSLPMLTAGVHVSSSTCWPKFYENTKLQPTQNPRNSLHFRSISLPLLHENPSI